MRTKKVNCIICRVATKVPIINEPWCNPCIEKEQDNTAKNYLGNFTYSRPPKYIIPQEDWAKFGY